MNHVLVVITGIAYVRQECSHDSIKGMWEKRAAMIASVTRGHAMSVMVNASYTARPLRFLVARPVARSFSAQRHDSIPILAYRLSQLERLACIEHLRHFSISGARHGFPRIGRSSMCMLQCQPGWLPHIDDQNHQGPLQTVWPHGVSHCAWPPKFALLATHLACGKDGLAGSPVHMWRRYRPPHQRCGALGPPADHTAHASAVSSASSGGWTAGMLSTGPAQLRRCLPGDVA